MTVVEQSVSSRTKVWPGLIYAAAAVVTITLFLIPAFIIRPFSHQSPGGLMLALRVKHWAPIGTAVGFVTCLVLFVSLWPNARKWSRVGLAASLVLVAVCTVMSRLNYFEWMFHPVHQPGFESASQTKLDASEMVLALNFSGDARAYPVQEMAYHHIVNDVVGGVPVAVTY